jgi:hypothetical protein
LHDHNIMIENFSQNTLVDKKKMTTIKLN